MTMTMTWIGFIASFIFGVYLMIQGGGMLILAAFINSFSGMKRPFAEWVLCGVGSALFIFGGAICYFVIKFAPFTIF